MGVTDGKNPRDLLRAFFQNESESLKPTLRRFVASAGLADGQIDDVATELWQEVVVQAMGSADKFDVSRPPVPWVLKIASNLIKRRKVEQAKRRKRFIDPESRPVVGTDDDGEMSPETLFDRIAEASENAEAFLAGRQQVSTWLNLLSASDRLVITNAILHGMDGVELATALRINPGTARVRLHRALDRLKKALSEQTGVITP